MSLLHVQSKSSIRQPSRSVVRYSHSAFEFSAFPILFLSRISPVRQTYFKKRALPPGSARFVTKVPITLHVRACRISWVGVFFAAVIFAAVHELLSFFFILIYPLAVFIHVSQGAACGGVSFLGRLHQARQCVRIHRLRLFRILFGSVHPVFGDVGYSILRDWVTVRRCQCHGVHIQPVCLIA